MDQTFPALSTMGNRIMVLGPTNAGKSTFTSALAQKLGVPAVHLDQFRHLPDTLYVQRPDAEFQTLHDAAIDWPGWVMDGSYSAVMPQRIARATAIVVLDESLLVRTRRYIWRTLFQRDRAGALEGNKDRLTLAMFAWLWKTRRNSDETRAKAKATGLPTVFTYNAAETEALYAAWGLTRGTGA